MSKTRERLLLPDVSRGFMLLLIAIANISWYLTRTDISPITNHPVSENSLDRLSQLLLMIFVDGKIYPLYAILFGYGMVQIQRSRSMRGDGNLSTGSYLLKRNFVLIIFGLVHTALLFAGDILTVYGIAGILLTPLVFLKNLKNLWVSFGALIGFHILFSLTGVMDFFSGLSGSASAPVEETVIVSGTEYSRSELTTLAVSEDYPLSMVSRLHELEIGIQETLIWSIILPSIILGVIAGKMMILEKISEHRRLLTALTFLLPAGLVIASIYSLIALEFTSLDPAHAGSLAFLNQLSGLLISVGYIAIISKLLETSQRVRESFPVRAFSNVGKNSLSFYLLQSIIMAPLMSLWGFGLGGTVGTFESIVIATLIWMIGIPIALAFERNERRGPAERLLRWISKL